MAFEREKEVKLETGSLDLVTVFISLEDFLLHVTMGFVAGDVIDAFWKLPQYKRGFTRIRTNDNRPELSIKIEDKGNNLDRIETNEFLTTTFETAIARKTLELGTEPKFLKKRHFTFFINHDRTASISCYTVTKDGIEAKKVYIEVECPDLNMVYHWERVIKKHFNKEHNAEFVRSPGSLYEMYIE